MKENELAALSALTQYLLLCRLTAERLTLDELPLAKRKRPGWGWEKEEEDEEKKVEGWIETELIIATVLLVLYRFVVRFERQPSRSSLTRPPTSNSFPVIQGFEVVVHPQPHRDDFASMPVHAVKVEPRRAPAQRWLTTTTTMTVTPGIYARQIRAPIPRRVLENSIKIIAPDFFSLFIFRPNP